MARTGETRTLNRRGRVPVAARADGIRLGPARNSASTAARLPIRILRDTIQQSIGRPGQGLERDGVWSTCRLTAEAVETKDRVKLDRVWSHAGLAVVEVEERYPGDPGARAQPDMSTRYRHFPMKPRLGSTVAVGSGRLRDHVVAALLQDNVKVRVVFGANEDHRGDHGEDVVLEPQAG